MRVRSLSDHKQIEKAITFLVTNINKIGTNSKPVILHSIRIGLHLEEQGYDLHIVQGGILHDILEDSDAEAGEVLAKFGEDVALIVKCNTFDEIITDKVEAYRENYRRIIDCGRDALVVRAADILDNMDYCFFTEEGTRNEWWITKANYFIEVSKDLLKNDSIYQELVDKFGKMASNFV